MSRSSVPRTSKVVSHEVPSIEVRVHGTQLHDVVVDRSSGRGNGQEKVVAGSRFRGVGVELATNFGEEKDEVCGLGGVLGVFCDAVSMSMR